MSKLGKFAAVCAVVLSVSGSIFGATTNTTYKAYSYVEQESGAWFNSGVNLTTGMRGIGLE